MEPVNIGLSREHWKELVLNSTLPCPRSGHSAVIYKTSMYVFGGHNGSDVLNDHYKLCLKTLAWKNLKSKQFQIPSGRTSHCAEIDPSSGLIYVHGGSGKDFGNTNKNDMFTYSIRNNTWELVISSGSGPDPRYGHSMSLFNRKMYVFGGTNGYEFYNDLYLFSIEAQNWVLLNVKNSAPLPRYKHTSRVTGEKLVIIGGTKATTTLKDVWEIELNSLDSSKIEVPEVGFLGQYTQAAEVYENSIFIMGESSSQKLVGSLWKFDLAKNTCEEITQYGSRPPAMCFYTMVLCEGYLVIFGGNIEQNRTNKTFVYRLSFYTRKDSSPISQLFYLSCKNGAHADTVVATQGNFFYVQKSVLQLRTPLLAQHIEGNSGGMRLNLQYSENVVKALLMYVYQDEVDPLLPLGDTLNLFSVAAIYGISCLLNKICDMLCCSVTVNTAKEIAVHISSNSVSMLFHRNEFRRNLDMFVSRSFIDEQLIENMNNNLELSSGEKVYWICVEFLAKAKITSGVSDAVKSDVARVQSKNGGKNVPQKTAKNHCLSNLDWCLALLYQTDKDFSINTQGSLVKIHKFIAICASKFFEGLFEAGTGDECKFDFPVDDMQNLVKYMYFGHKGIEHLSPEKQSLLMSYADYFLLTNTELHDYIGKMIFDILDYDNVFEMLVNAYRMKTGVMKNMILEYFIKNYKKLVERQEMYTLSVEILVDIHRWRASRSD